MGEFPEQVVDRFAQALADGMTAPDAARAANRPARDARALLQHLERLLGPQAR